MTINDIKAGSIIEINNAPYEVLAAKHSKFAQRKAVLQTKLKNLISGNVLSKNFQQKENIKQTQITRINAKFFYRTKNEFFFQNESGEKFAFQIEHIRDKQKYLKKDLKVELIKYKGKIINIILPIKAVYRVKEAPPRIKGNTADSGSKIVILETDAQIKTPLFIKEGDKIEINTETGEYVRRIN